MNSDNALTRFRNFVDNAIFPLFLALIFGLVGFFIRPYTDYPMNDIATLVVIQLSLALLSGAVGYWLGATRSAAVAAARSSEQKAVYVAQRPAASPPVDIPNYQPTPSHIQAAQAARPNLGNITTSGRRPVVNRPPLSNPGRGNYNQEGL